LSHLVSPGASPTSIEFDASIVTSTRGNLLVHSGTITESRILSSTELKASTMPCGEVASIDCIVPPCSATSFSDGCEVASPNAITDTGMPSARNNAASCAGFSSQFWPMLVGHVQSPSVISTTSYVR
jgi:hypothetical protein